MFCYFCRFEFDSAEFPIACPACGYALGDEEPLFGGDEYSIVCNDGQYSIVEGYVKNSVFFGSFDDCDALKEVLQVM